MEQPVGEQVKHPLEEVYFEEMERIVRLFKKGKEIERGLMKGYRHPIPYIVYKTENGKKYIIKKDVNVGYSTDEFHE